MNFMASFRSCGAFSFLPGADQGAGGLVNGQAGKGKTCDGRQLCSCVVDDKSSDPLEWGRKILAPLQILSLVRTEASWEPGGLGAVGVVGGE